MPILHFAAKRSNIEVCEYLLEQGADPYILDSQGKTVYDYALENKDEDVVALFKEME